MQTEKIYDQEQWKQHPVYGLYEVSNMGRVRNKKTRRVLRAAYPPGRSYSIVNLMHHNPDGRVSVAVHRLVAETWLGLKPSREYQVRHLNGDPRDNRASNLCWGTVAENKVDALRHGKLHVKARSGQFITLTTELIKKVKEQVQAMDCFLVSAFYGVPLKWVEDIKAGKRWAFVN